MTNRSKLFGGLVFGAMALIAALPGQARAEFFEYNTSVSITSVTTPSGGAVTGTPPNTATGGNTQTVTNNGTTVTFGGIAQSGSDTTVPHLDGTYNPGAGLFGTDISLLTITLGGLTNTAQSFDFNYSITLTVTDYPTLNSTTPDGTGSIVVTGRFAGTYSSRQQNTTFFSFATIPSSGIFTAGTNPSPYQLIGLQPLRPSSTGGGGLSGHLNNPPSAVPEPASMIMLGMGGIGAFKMFRRRKAVVTA